MQNCKCKIGFVENPHFSLKLGENRIPNCTPSGLTHNKEGKQICIDVTIIKTERTYFGINIRDV